jgi:hypothetical protein
MASQYITFMIVFTLGLTMVIVTNNMFTTMSEQFRLNIAEFEMNQILEEIQIQILQNLLLSSSFNQTIEQHLILPINLAQGFGYTIEISNSTNNYIILYGATFNEDISQTMIFSVGSAYSIKAQGDFQSTSLMLTVRIEKIGTDIVITIS